MHMICGRTSQRLGADEPNSPRWFSTLCRRNVKQTKTYNTVPIVAVASTEGSLCIYVILLGGVNSY